MNRAYVLAAVISLVLCSIFLLPPFQQVESAMRMEIPGNFGSWRTLTYPPSEKEIKTLAADTEFAKARCQLPRYDEMSFITGEAPIDRADLSIVLSGYDLANSIHRPERCMPAQGHKILSSSTSELEIDDQRRVPVTRLVSTQSFEIGEGAERRSVHVASLTYYFFVGHDAVTASHTERTLLDIKDRILKGEAQRWAYVTVTMPYVDKPQRSHGEPLTQEEADDKIRQLLTELAEKNIDWSRVRL